MLKIYNNFNDLPIYVISLRLNLDEMVSVKSYDSLSLPKINPLTGAPLILHYVSIESILTNAQIATALSTPQTQAETNAYNQYVGARASLKAIPSWSTWTEAEALAWEQTNVGARITTARSSLPATLTLATARTAILGLITILDNIQVLLVALVRMIIAIRNKVF